MSDRFCGFYSVGAHRIFLFLKILIIFTVACAIRWGGDGVSEVSRKNKKGGVIIPDDNIT